MPQSNQLRISDVHAIHNLVGECRDLGDDHRSWRLHLLAGMARLISADVVVGSEVGGISKGQPKELDGTPAEWGFENGFDRQGWLNALDLLQNDPTYTCMLHHYFRLGGRVDGQAMRRSDLLSSREWERSLEYEAVYRVGDLDHNLSCFRTLPNANDAALGMVLCRGAGRRDYSARDLQIVETTLSSIAPLVGRVLADASEPAPGDLTLRTRQVLQCLLEGDADKQIAARLGISRFTVNVYTKQVFRHFAVESRAELLARWLRRGWSARCAWSRAPGP